MPMENEEFKLTPQESQDGLTAADFQLVQSEKEIHDTRMAGKSTTYFKDIVHRFVKNKSSVFGFCLLGIILVGALVCAFAIPGSVDADYSNQTEQYLPPKLFPAGTGFWDGTVEYQNRPYDENNETPVLKYGESVIVEDGIVGEVNVYDGIINSETEFGTGGSVEIMPSYWFGSPYFDFGLTEAGALNVTDLSLTLNLSSGLDSTYAGYADPQYSIMFQPVDENGASVGGRFALEDLSDLDNIDGEVTIPLTSALKAITPEQLQYEVTVNVPNEGEDSGEAGEEDGESGENEEEPGEGEGGESGDSTVTEVRTASRGRIVIMVTNSPLFVSSASFTGADAPSDGFAITDACQDLWRTNQIEAGEEEGNWWVRPNASNVTAFGVSAKLCSFRYDPYTAVYGLEYQSVTDAVTSTIANRWKQNGYIDYETDEDGIPVQGTVRVLDSQAVPIVIDEEHPAEVVGVSAGGITTWVIRCYSWRYREMGYTSMPVHLFGTDSAGRDMLKLVSRGLLYSLAIGVAVSAICFLFGLAWGSFSGYEGGVIDLAMERVVDILSYIPGMVMITLFVLNWGHTFWVFMLAMCVTGWIGTSALTRTQFYRFKRREYVLASRSLGASDARLIYRHILPNSLGTIITSSVLMVPSVIFSEASLSYLGLGLQDVMSLGTIINNNQAAITTVGSASDHSYLILFPIVLLALLLICFELFGQGLRDAVNPSLKGSDE